MVFVSEIFLLYFLPVVLIGVYCLRNAPVKGYLIWLTLVSLIFYAWEFPVYLILIFFSVLTNWILTTAMDQSVGKRRNVYLILTISLNVCFLIFFKYTKFIVSNFNGLISLYGYSIVSDDSTFGRLVNNIIFPLGISFYTFHLLSYAIDLFGERIKRSRSFVEFFCYVVFFPQLVAGPIVRYSQVEKDLAKPSLQKKNIEEGLFFFILGFAKKSLIADSLAPFVNIIFDKGIIHHGLLNLVGVVMYAFQVYFDFSGYSEMAVGLGLFMGIRLPQNFNSPYKSTSVTEFWRRWHITLSLWFKDYLFYPMSMHYLRIKNTLSARYLPLFYTMVLIGFWHGASWTYLFFGVIHGLAIVSEDYFVFRHTKRPLPFMRIWFWFVILTAYVFFRSADFETATKVYSSILTNFIDHNLLSEIKSLPIDALISLVIFIPVTVLVFMGRNVYEMNKKMNLFNASILTVLFLLSIGFALARDYIPFIYFQF